MSEITGQAWDSKLFKRVLKYSRPHSFILWLGLILTFFLAFLSPLKPYIIGLMVGDYVRLGLEQDLLMAALLIVVILIVESLGQFYLAYLANDLGQRVIKDLRDELFRHILRLKLKYFDQHPIGMLVTRAVSDIETISEIFSQGILVIIGDILKLLGVLSFMFYMNWELTLIVLLPIPVLLLATHIFKKVIKRSFQDVRSQVARLNSFVQEHISGMNIIQIFNHEKNEAKRFKEINQKHKEAHIRSVMAYSIFFPVVENLSAISIALLILYSVGQITYYDSDFGKVTTDLTAFILYVHMLFRPIRMLADRFNTLQMGMVGSSRVFKVLDINASIVQQGDECPQIINGEIEFNNVVFGYDPLYPILKGISFKVEAGKTVAIVGASGAGKTSIINLISRFYEFQSGSITLDGNDIRNLNLKYLRDHISVVLQDVFLYSDSIINNITLGDDDIKEEDVINAAKMVGVHDFIQSLPGGYLFNVKERGGVLSMGQRQLISFIRSYVYNPEILILDEATSSIDTETEELIQNAINNLTTGRTSIVIAHRLSTIRNADKIIVMDNGEIIEEGTHEELIKLNKEYCNLYDKQFFVENT